MRIAVALLVAAIVRALSRFKMFRLARLQEGMTVSMIRLADGELAFEVPLTTRDQPLLTVYSN